MEKINVGNGVRLYQGDCLEVLKSFPDNSVHSVVCDPPYGLTDDIDVVEVMKCWLNGTAYKHPKKGFMGKDWDSFVPDPIIWKEVFRVLKPGGHLLSFGGTRTYDLMALSVRIAGFEIRDQMQWLYGQGFPKSMNISKKIDEKFGLEREVVGKRIDAFGDSEKSETDDGRNLWGKSSTKEVDLKGGPVSDQAKEWEGWGTALKPANEPILLARKPISEKTVAENVLKWGVGGLNIDGSRIKIQDGDTKQATAGRRVAEDGKGWGINQSGSTYEKGTGAIFTDVGRWPANIILDEEAAKILDEQSEPNMHGAGNKKSYKKLNDDKSPVAMNNSSDKNQSRFGDSGGASRFFYIAKTSTSEKNAGLSNKESQKVNDGRDTPIDNPFQRGETLRKNTHPTVKPIKLIKYLIKLITPKGGIVLDHYNGSGTAGCAVVELNKEENLDIRYIGIDREKEYIDISVERINHVINKDLENG